jgi:ATP-dependent Clp protease ATP-binding subunit ClpA
MDDDVKQKLTTLYADIMAVRLVVNEALAVALSHETNPDMAVSLARKAVEDIIDSTVEKAVATTTESNSESRRSLFEKVRASVNAQLDAIEKRVSRLRNDRTVQ